MNVQELRRGFRLHALHAAEVITARQSMANESLLAWSNPRDQFIVYAELPGQEAYNENVLHSK